MPVPVPDAAESEDDEVLADAPADTHAVPLEVRRAVVPAAWHGWRVDKALVAMVPEFSRSYLQQLVDQGALCIDELPANSASKRLKAGQRLAVELRPTAASQSYVAQTMPLSILHEDADLLVLNKPAGLVVHPGAGNWSGTLLNGLLAHHAAAAGLPRAGIVHRLDKDTSGVMVVGKSTQAVTALVRDIAARRVQRHYLAIAHGQAAQREFAIDAPIGRDPAVRIRMAVVAHGKPARTDATCLADGAGLSAWACKLHTGRTHQIRVHMAHVGHPLVGDVVYGGKPALGLARQGLHASQLRLTHPSGARELQFDAPAPEDFEAAWRQLTGNSARWKDRA